MRTFFKVLFVVIPVMFLFSLPTYADDGIVECPKSHVYLNNNDLEFKGTVIIKEDCVMLPLYQITSKLGVEDNFENISYDYKNNSITVNLNNKKLVITTDDKTASIGGTIYKLDVAPFKYKNGQVYVPANFIARAFDKVYAWDSFSEAVLLGNSEKSDKSQQILEKSFRAMKMLKRVKLKSYEYFYMSGMYGENISIEDLDMKIDRQNKQMRISRTEDYNGRRVIEKDYYCFNNACISSNKNSGYWSEEIFPRGINAELNQYEATWILLPDDELYSNLSVLESVDKKHFILAGDARPHWGSEMIGSNLDVDRECSTTIVINKSNYLISNIEIKKKTYGKDTDEVIYNRSNTYDFSDYDGDFNAKAPKELLSMIKIISPEDKIIDDENLNISDIDKKKIDVLAKNSFVSCIDSFFSNPYDLEFNEGVLFIDIRDEKDFKDFNKLSDDGKKFLAFKVLDDNYNQLLGSQHINVYITYKNKMYYLVPARYDIRLLDYPESFPGGQEIKVIFQDRKNNTYNVLKR